MPAAEPARTPAVVVNTAGGASVIPLHDRVRRHAGRGPQMSEGPEAGSGDSSSLALLAEHVETKFIEQGHSLSDEPTAEVYTTTLTIVCEMLQGAQTEGIVTDSQRVELEAMLKGLMEVPRRVG